MNAEALAGFDQKELVPNILENQNIYWVLPRPQVLLS